MKSFLLMLCFGMLQAQGLKRPMPDWIHVECSMRKIDCNEFTAILEKCSSLYKVISASTIYDTEMVGNSGEKSNSVVMTLEREGGDILVSVTNTPFMRSIDKTSSPFVLFYEWEYDAAPDLMFDNANNKCKMTKYGLEVVNTNFNKKIEFSVFVDADFLVCSRNGKPYAVFTVSEGKIEIRGQNINLHGLTGNFKELQRLYKRLVDLRMNFYSSQIGLKTFELKSK